MGCGLYFRVLGPLRAERDGVPLDVGGPQSRTVLALLLLEAGRTVAMERLAEALWEDVPPPSWRVQMQGIVSRLRRSLGTDGERASAPIETRPPGYRLPVPDGDLDLARFRREVADAADLAASGRPEPATELLHTALARWRGPVCADVTSPHVRRVADDLEDLRLTATEDRIDADIELGRWDGLVTELQSLVREHPLRERCAGQLMTVLTRAGRPADALAAFRGLRERLVEELGIEPSTGVQQLHRAILTGVRGPGEAAAAGGRPYVVPCQLPADVPEHVGREDILEELATALSAGSRAAPPCVAITGPGGIGKTALALHLAHRLRGVYPDGQLHARMRERTGPAEVLAAFLNALGVPPAGVPQGMDERGALFRELLSTRRVLIVLDDVTDETSLRHLLPGDPRCAVLVTSRRRLSGAGAMRVVALEVLPPRAGMELFRATAGPGAGAEPDAAAEIARHCGGLPLAIRIAAARLASRPGWTVADMAARLASHRDRLDWLQQGDVGVRASFHDSYASLTGGRRRLFRLLGLLKLPEFPSWVPAALLDERPAAAERLLDDLVDMHLVEPAGRGVTGPRYRMHDLIHLLAAELARQDDPAERRAAVRRVHGGWQDLAAVADAELPHWYGLDPAPAPAWRAPHHDDVRAAPLTWFDEERIPLICQVRSAAAEDRPGWPIAQSMATYLDLRGRYDEWVHTLRAGLRAAERDADARGVACMLGLLVDAEASRFELATGLGYTERAMAAYRDLPPAAGGEPAGADPAPPPSPLLTEARRAGDPLGVGRAVYTQALVRREAGEHGGYAALFEEAACAFRACGAPMSELWTLKNLWLADLKRGRAADAAGRLARGGEVIAEIGDLADAVPSVAEIGALLIAADRPGEAAALARETLRRAGAHGHQWDEAAALDILAELSRIGGDLHAAVDAHLKALAAWRRLGKDDRISRIMDTLAGLCEEMGDPATAALYRTEVAA